MTADMYLTQLKILYVEDDDDTRENLKQYLRKKAGKVVTAADGAEGLRKYEEEKPDIVIADLLMPGLSGMEMLKRIRAQGGRCPFIITSSVSETDTIIEAVDLGIVKYVLKPIILDKLLDTLNKVAEEIRKGSPLFDDVEKKLEMESRIKQAVTAFLKQTVGKDPRDLTVFISDENVEISAYGMITPLERKLMEDKHNISLIEHIHTSYYKVVRPELEYKIKEIIGMEVQMVQTGFTAGTGTDTLSFRISK